MNFAVEPMAVDPENRASHFTPFRGLLKTLEILSKVHRDIQAILDGPRGRDVVYVWHRAGAISADVGCPACGRRDDQADQSAEIHGR